MGGAPCPTRHFATERLPFVDFLRGVSALFVVAHHLAFYGPLSDIAYPLAPAVIDWLYEYARMAVHVFLVIAGFGTARRLSRLSLLGAGDIASELWARYRRVGLPYVAALALAVTSNELARRWMTHPSISAPPTAAQLLAHVTLLTQVLGFEALTAGVWYLAIDFQLVILCLALLALSQRVGGLFPGATSTLQQRIFLVVSFALGVSSLLWLNRLSALDAWAPYFFGSYFAGMAVEWAQQRRGPRWLGAAYLAVMGLALLLDFRPRLLVALGAALLLAVAAGGHALGRWPRSRWAQGLGKISYSLFLVHFPVCLLVNAWGSTHLPKTPFASVLAMLVALSASLFAAVLFYRWVELPLIRATPAADRSTGRTVAFKPSVRA